MQWLRPVAQRDQRLWSLLCALLLPGYIVVFVSDGLALSGATIINALGSAGSLWVVGLLARPAFERLLAVQHTAWRMIALVVAGLLFAVLWYVVVASFLGWANAGFRAGGSIPDFSGPAFRWQILQGFLAAAVLFALVDATLMSQRTVETGHAPAPPDKEGPRHLLIRDGDEIIRIAVDEIVSLNAGDEQVTVSAGARKLTVRRSLNELEEQLPEHFLRIHRSAIVNLNAIERLEPAGSGRLSVHLSDGTSPVASRSGARALRQRAI
ncbi:LytTR family DNA-binding domain-containing protein [Porphyrobacter sp. YT40]|uniref:LytR/AlgR family response regulator transcription factor n=1 Tax=Porphyrobacter sp. YT40 TaxID=2547601 RepID=UPI0011449DE4|nr:LytTR family DNA-binding domain-containing protein [Porphyrobacter sp. YT40]QDH33299.1 LytTR family transcriptional regulator [Porphyrobacter sp. YT40]